SIAGTKMLGDNPVNSFGFLGLPRYGRPKLERNSRFGPLRSLETRRSHMVAGLPFLSERLGGLTWLDCRTLQVEYRWSEGRRERVVETASELVSKGTRPPDI